MHTYSFVHVVIIWQASLSLYSTGLEINVRCDDQGVIYVDGKYLDNTKNYRDVLVKTVEDTSKSIAVYCLNLEHSGGILASASNGLISDDSWRCSDYNETGWFDKDFDDRQWGPAYVIGQNNGETDWTKDDRLLDDAQWIFSSKDQQEHHGIYCRGTLGPVSAVIRLDDHGQILVDGSSVGRTDSHDEAWRGTFSSVPQLLAVQCTNTGREGWILGAVSTGSVTDSRWKCSDSFQTNWAQITYDDTNWGRAHVVRTNTDATGWTRDERFPETAEVIWSHVDQVFTKTTVFCRGVLGIQVFAKTTPGTVADIYIDGEPQGDPVTADQVWISIIHKTTSSVALHAENTAGDGTAVVVALANDMGAGSSVKWKCTQQLYEGWEEKDFDSTLWPDATFMNNVTIGGHAGQWMWASDGNTSTQHSYCRGDLACGCDQMCEAEIPGHTHNCACYTGYTLVNNGSACEDIDECADDGDLCQETCVNVPGSYACLCQAGYTPDPEDTSTCVDINECEEKTHNCSETASEQCVNVDGGFNCDATASSTTPSTIPTVSGKSDPATSPKTTVQSTSPSGKTPTTAQGTTPTTTSVKNSPTPSNPTPTDPSQAGGSSTAGPTGNTKKLKGGDSGVNATAIVVPIIVCVILIALVILVLYVVRRKRRRGVHGHRYTVDNPLVDSWSQHAQDDGIRYGDLADN